MVMHKGGATTFSLTLTQPDSTGNMESFSTGAVFDLSGGRAVY